MGTTTPTQIFLESQKVNTSEAFENYRATLLHACKETLPRKDVISSIS